MFHVAMEKVPLPSVCDGARGGSSTPAAARTLTRLIGITKPLELPDQRYLDGADRHSLLSPQTQMRGEADKWLSNQDEVIAVTID